MIEKYPQEYLRKIVTPDFCKFFQGQRILITGASGLIGTHFTLLFQMFNQYATSMPQEIYIINSICYEIISPWHSVWHEACNECM